jgi:hypothetical protein
MVQHIQCIMARTRMHMQHGAAKLHQQLITNCCTVLLLLEPSTAHNATDVGHLRWSFGFKTTRQGKHHIGCCMCLRLKCMQVAAANLNSFPHLIEASLGKVSTVGQPHLQLTIC